MSRLQSRILSRKKFIDGSKYIFWPIDGFNF
jgi:hypothetical protein